MPESIPKPPATAQTNYLNFYLAGGLILLCLLVFWPVTEAQFVNYDDPDFVTANPHVLQGLRLSEIGWAFRGLYIYWQPMTWLSYMLDWELHGQRAGGYHLTNLLLHAASTAILFLALNRMTGKRWPSAMVAVIFALHPLHVENVAWISERKGVLSGFFWMLAVYAYARYVEVPKLKQYLLVTLFVGLALMSKPLIATLPFVLLLLDIWPLRRFQSFVGESAISIARRIPQFSTARLVLEKLPLLLLAILTCAINVVAQNKAGAIYQLERFPLQGRILHAAGSYWTYIQKTFWPGNLAVFYPFEGAWPKAHVVTAFVILAGISALSLWQFRRRPYLFVGWSIFLGVLFPVCGLFQTGDQAFADRYMYLPVIGLSLALVWFAWESLSTSSARRMSLAIFASLLTFALGIKSATQVEYWKDSQILFSHACEVVPNNYLAQTIYGTLLSEQGRPGEALAYFDASLRLHPHYAEAHYNLGNALVALKQFTNAVDHYRQAVAPKPDYWEAHLNLGTVLQHLGQVDDAIIAYRLGLKYNPQHYQGNFNLATLLALQGKTSAAVTFFRKAVEARPDSVDALDRAAWILSTGPEDSVRNGPEAVQMATRAAQLTGGTNPQVLNTLAAACAEAGNFSEAARVAQSALEIATSTGRTNLASVIVELLPRYKAGQPFRENRVQ
jgi:Flp pilus assembly protein TadD